jgi:hypothetical protein
MLHSTGGCHDVASGQLGSRRGHSTGS